MNTSVHICVRKTSPWRYTVRAAKSMPALAPNEVAIKLNLEIPDALFTRPQLEAKVTIPDDAVAKPVIEAQVIDNVQEIIKQQTGFDVRLEVVEEKKDD